MFGASALPDHDKADYSEPEVLRGQYRSPRKLTNQNMPPITGGLGSPETMIAGQVV
jgi:hypothetical protein